MNIAQTTFVVTFRRSSRSHVARVSGVATATCGSLIRTARSEFEASPDRRRHFQTARGVIPSAAAIDWSPKPCSYSSRRFVSSPGSRGLFRPTLGGRPCLVRHWATEHLLTPLLFAIAPSVMPLASIARRASCISGRAPVTFYLPGSRRTCLDDARRSVDHSSLESRDSPEALRTENRYCAPRRSFFQGQWPRLGTGRPSLLSGSTIKVRLSYGYGTVSEYAPDRRNCRTIPLNDAVTLWLRPI